MSLENEARKIPSFPMMGMPPTVWGPILWTSMHIVSLGYSINPTDEEKQATANYYNALVHTIPCHICREHYKQHIAEMPVENAIHSRDELIYWVFVMHNKVNHSLGKPELTFAQFIQKMAYLANKNAFSFYETTPVYVLPTVLLMGIAAGVAVYALYKSK